MRAVQTISLHSLLYFHSFLVGFMQFIEAYGEFWFEFDFIFVDFTYVENKT